MASLFDIGKSGLGSYREALAVTGQNIANINTDGYKRRGVSLEEVSANQSGINSTGNSPGLGVRVAEIQRSFDEFLLNKVRSATAYAESTSTFSANIQQLEDIILPGDANLGAAIGRFFVGLQEIASNPSDLAARTVALEQANQLAESFNETASLITQFQDGLATQATQQLGDLNVLSTELAAINRQLSTAGGATQNNSLLDSRDALIDKLSQYVEVTVELNDKGVARLTLGDSGNGPRLVDMAEAKPLGAEYTEGKLQFIISPGGDNILTSQVTNGSLAGIASANSAAAEVLSEIDNMAFTFVREFNAIHSQGLNLEGQPSGNLFRAVDVQMRPGGANTGSASTELIVNDYNLVMSGKVTFSYDADADLWTGRDDAGKVIASGRNQVSLPGVQINFLGQAKGFDQFIYDTETGSAAGVAVAIKRPQDFAAASPLLVSADPRNASDAIIAAVPSGAVPPPDLPDISEIFSNNRSAVAATGFLSGGAVAVIPATATNVDIFSLSSQSTARFTTSPEALADASNIAVTIRSLDDAGQQVEKNIDFNVTFADIKGFEGSWLDFNQIADLINVGTITGTVRGSGETVSLASLGGFASGTEGNLTFALTENDFSSAVIDITGSQSVDGAVTASTPTASDVQIFTREGRHIAGTTQSEASRDALQAMMTSANGFNEGAVYLGDYLNASGEDGYLNLQATATDNAGVLVTTTEDTDGTRVSFAALEGIDTDEASVDGLAASAATVGYSMSVGNLSASIVAADIEGPNSVDVAAAMLKELRSNAPLATMVGSADAAPTANDSVRIRFEEQIYTITMTEGEPLVSGGEPGRLDAFFDSQQRLNIVSTAGSISRSQITVLAEVGDEANVAAARRFGLMHEMTQVPTRFSGEFRSIEGSADPNLDTIVTLTFDRDDSYNLGFVFDGRPDFGAGALQDMAFSLSNMSVENGDASAVAAAINSAVASNVTDDDGGADLTSLVTATAIGSVVKLALKNGIGAEIQSINGVVSTGEGQVDIQSFTEVPVTTPATAALQLEEGKHFALQVNGQRIEVNTTEAGIRAATDGTLAGAIADVGAAIADAINLNSGAGSASVSSTLSATGATLSFNMSDSTGNPIVVSDLEVMTHDAVAAGSIIIDVNTSASSPTSLQHGDYLTSTGGSGGSALAITPNTTGEIYFASTDQYYKFQFDANGDGALGTNEMFVIDGVTKDFDTEIAAVADQMAAMGGEDLRVSVSGSTISMLNLRDDGSNFAFGTSQALESPALDEVTPGVVHFRPEHASDDTLQDEADSFELLAGMTGVSTGGRPDAAPDATAALQFEEGKIYSFAVNGRTVTLDTTASGLRAATGGNLAGAISDVEDAIRTAIDATSGLGTSNVSSANSIGGSTIRLDLNDGTGNPIVISDFQQLARSAQASGTVTVTPDISASTAFARSHGDYMTTDGQSASAALSIADGTIGRISFGPQSQRFSFTLDVDGNGSIGSGESYVIDGVTGDFDSQLATVAADINAVSGLSARIVDDALQITNTRGDGTALTFGTGNALASDPFDEVTTGSAWFRSELPAGASLDLDSAAVPMTTGSMGVSTDGMMGAADNLTSFTDSYSLPDFDLRLDGDQILVVAEDGADMPDITTDAASLAKQRYTLSNLPGEDLIMIVGDEGARRLSVQYDLLPEAALQPHRDIEIRVTDVDAGEITYFDVETQTSLATRILDEEQAATALQFEVGFTGLVAADDKFLISGNSEGTGDNRNVEQLLQLQSANVMGAGSGGFQKVFSATVAKLGAVGQSSEIAAESARALREASLEAESEFTGVNLDTEAANLIEQQQAYQASARILSTARELFETLIQSL